jgi:hypothetical protein
MRVDMCERTDAERSVCAAEVLGPAAHGVVGQRVFTKRKLAVDGGMPLARKHGTDL